MATATPTPEHLDVLIVGAGLSGIGAALPPQTRLPRASPSRSWSRAPPSAARGTSSATPACARDTDMFTLGYSFRPVGDVEVDRRRRLDPATTCARPPPSTASTGASATATASSAPTGRRPTRGGPSRSSAVDDDGDGRPRASPARSSSSARGYYRLRAGLHARPSPATDAFDGRDRPPAALARRLRRHGQARRRHRQRGHRRDAGAVARGHGGAGDDAAALAQLRRDPAVQRRRLRQDARAACAPQSGRTRSRAGRASARR